MYLRHRLLSALIAAVCLPALAPPAHAAPSRPFARDSFWNAPLKKRAPVDRASRALVADLADQVGDYGPWINTWQYSTPVYRVGARQRRVRVKLDTRWGPLERAFASVPVPPSARPAQGEDRHMVVWQPARDTMWEFWKMERRPDGWHARWGGRMRRVSKNPGHFLEKTWGATATGLPLLGGLITVKELRRGRIDHALDISLVRTRRYSWSWPARRTDGWIDDRAAIPEGARFRLDPRLDIGKLGLPRVTRIIARAAQRYGIVVRDKGGAVTFFAEDASRHRTNPYYGRSGLYEGRDPHQLLERFPWHRLQALRLRMRGGG